MDDHRQTTSDEDQLTHRRKHRTTTTAGKARGRPYGSKNKPKPPIIIVRESPNTLITHFIEIPPNHDIIQTLTDFTKTRQRALCILTGTGTVTNISLRQPPPPHQQPKSDSASSSSALNLTGRFEILSMSGAFMPPPAPPPASGMSVFVCGGHGGMVLGGKVVGRLMTMGVVVVVVASFANSPYERLPLPMVEDENNNEEVVGGDKDVKIESLVSKDCADQQGRQQLLMMMSNASPAAGLLHEIGSDEFWGGRQQPPF